MQMDHVALDSRCEFVFTASLTPAATSAATSAEQAFTVTASAPVALRSTDHVSVTGPGSGNAVALGGARINATGQLVIAFINPTAGSLTHAAGTFIVKIARA